MYLLKESLPFNVLPPINDKSESIALQRKKFKACKSTLTCLAVVKHLNLSKPSFNIF